METILTSNGKPVSNLVNKALDDVQRFTTPPLPQAIKEELIELLREIRQRGFVYVDYDEDYTDFISMPEIEEGELLMEQINEMILKLERE